MSNLSAALNSLSSTTVVDFYMHWRPAADDRERMMISRSSTVIWAFVLFAIAIYSVRAGGKGHVVEGDGSLLDGRQATVGAEKGAGHGVTRGR